MSPGTVLGFAGDFTTLAGGIVLALSEINGVKEAVDAKSLRATVEDLKGLLTVDGVELRDEEQVELIFRRRSSHRAKVGSSLLVIGFLFLLLSRIADVRKEAKENKMIQIAYVIRLDRLSEHPIIG